MLIPSQKLYDQFGSASLSRRVNANSQPKFINVRRVIKLIKKGEC